jgi:hypothetical protein
MVLEMVEKATKLPDGWTQALFEKAKSVKAKRAKTVIDHIFQHGYITSDDLQNTYGYRHTSRAVRDVRELGIPIESFRIEAKDGRKISAYRFANPTEQHHGTLAGRRMFPLSFKKEMAEYYESRCAICSDYYGERYLQIDHRVPFEIGGESVEVNLDVNEFMWLCASCNRAKSWSCEHCPNWTTKDVNICKLCYWANPEKHEHIATENIRRLALVWKGASTSDYDELVASAEKQEKLLPDYVKLILMRYLKKL